MINFISLLLGDDQVVSIFCHYLVLEWLFFYIIICAYKVNTVIELIFDAEMSKSEVNIFLNLIGITKLSSKKLHQINPPRTSSTYSQYIL